MYLLYLKFQKALTLYATANLYCEIPNIDHQSHHKIFYFICKLNPKRVFRLEVKVFFVPECWYIYCILKNNYFVLCTPNILHDSCASSLSDLT